MPRHVTLRAALGSMAAAMLIGGCVSLAPSATQSALPSFGITTPAPTVAASLATLTPATAGLPTAAPTAAPPTAAPPTVAPPTANPPTARPDPTPTEPDPTPTEPTETLDHSAEPNYGSVDLEGGFVPDPHTRRVTSGGTVDVSYLGGGCRGFASSAPDYEVSFSNPGDMLRFYFLGDGGDTPAGPGDTTLIINDPIGGWSCGDDSFGTRNPTVDFESPLAGRYDIWVASYNEGDQVSGDINVTELESNHP